MQSKNKASFIRSRYLTPQFAMEIWGVKNNSKRGFFMKDVFLKKWEYAGDNVRLVYKDGSVAFVSKTDTTRQPCT